MGKTDDLLLLESAGELPANMQADLDLLREAGIVPPKGGASAAPAPAVAEDAPMVKKAVPDTTRPRTFGGHLASEVSAGLSEIGSGLVPQPTGNVFLDRVQDNPMVKGLRAGLGGMRTITSPITAMSRAGADVTGGNLAEYLAPKIGADMAATIGATVGTPIEFALSGGMSISKLAPRVHEAITGASKIIANLAGMQTAAKVSADAAQVGLKWAASRLPGSVDAQIGIGIEKAQQVLERLKTAAQARLEIAKARFAPHAEEDINVPLGLARIRYIAADMRQHGLTSVDDPNLSELMRLQKVIEGKNGLVSAGWLDDELTAIGQRVGAMEGRGEYVHPGWSSIFKGFAQDASNVYPTTTKTMTGGTPGGFKPTTTISYQDVYRGGKKSALEETGRTVNPTGAFVYPQPGIETTKPFFPTDAGPLFRAKDAEIMRGKAVEEVNLIFEKLKRIKRGKDADNPDVNANQVLNWMSEETNPKLAKALHPDDRKDLEAIFAALAELPASAPGKGVKYGAGVGLAMGGLAGGAAYLGGAGTTGMAAAGGAATSLMALSHMLLPSRIGRKYLRAVLESGPMSQTKIDLLTSTANALGEGERVAADIMEALKVPNIPIDEKISAAMQRSRMTQ